MAFDTYMIIGGGDKVIGEATAAGLSPAKGWFEIYSFSIGASNPTTVGTSGKGLSAGKVSVSSFNVMKKSEQSSSALFLSCCNGQHYPTAQVVMRKAAGNDNKQSIFLQYDFTDVMVESIQWSGSSGGDDTPTEAVSFAFAKIKTTYSMQNTETGKLEKAPNGEATWDLTLASS